MVDHRDSFSSLLFNSCSVFECVPVFLFGSLCLCVTVPLHPLLCNCLGLGWQSRPDKRTQIVSRDRLKRSVGPLLYLSPSITCVWQKQCHMMDGCSTLSLSISYSVCSHSLISLHLVSLHLPVICSFHFFCNLSFFFCLSFSFHEVFSLLMIVCACLS